MIRCPICHGVSKVIDSRPDSKETSIHRRRVCVECQFRFSTNERVTEYDADIVDRIKNRVNEEFRNEPWKAAAIINLINSEARKK